jgi:hypothetical protein
VASVADPYGGILGFLNLIKEHESRYLSGMKASHDKQKQIQKYSFVSLTFGM